MSITTPPPRGSVYTGDVSTDAEIQRRFDRLAPMLDERTLRLFAAAEADAIGYGGVSRVSVPRASGCGPRGGRAGGSENRRSVTFPPLLLPIVCPRMAAVGN